MASRMASTASPMTSAVAEARLETAALRASLRIWVARFVPSVESVSVAALAAPDLPVSAAAACALPALASATARWSSAVQRANVLRILA